MKREHFKKRKDLAQVLTILRQKQILEQLESQIQRPVNEKKAHTGQSSSVTKSTKGGRTGLSK